MDEFEEHERMIRRLERERVMPPPRSPRQPMYDDSPEATARRRKALLEATAEERHLKVVGG